VPLLIARGDLTGGDVGRDSVGDGPLRADTAIDG
jgi:hypothetical protein